MKTVTKKLSFIVWILLAICLLPISSCEKWHSTKPKDDVNDSIKDPSAIIDKYYINAQFDGDWRLNQTNEESYCQSYQGVCHTNSDNIFKNYVSLTIDSKYDFFTINYIAGLIGDTIKFNSGNIYANLFWYENGSRLSSEYLLDQGDSYLHIENAYDDGASNGIDFLMLRGKFKCLVATELRDTIKTVTNGIFSIRVAAEVRE